MFERYHVRFTFLTRLYGTVPKDEETYQKYIVDPWIEKEEPSEEEIQEELSSIPEAVEDEDELVPPSYVGFLINDEDGRSYLGTHMIKGHCKETCYVLRRVPGSESGKATIRSYKKLINLALFGVGVEPEHPRKIFLHLPEGGEVTHHERGFKVSGKGGDRNILVDTDVYPVGTTIEFYIQYYPNTGFSEPLLREWFDYGEWVGMGSWRGSGEKGRFSYEMSKVEELD